MTFFFKCGTCNHSYTVDTERVEAMTFGNYCPNCESVVPRDLKIFAQQVALMKSKGFQNWEVQAFSAETIKLKTRI